MRILYICDLLESDGSTIAIKQSESYRGLRFNNQECLISEGSQTIVYNGILGLWNKDVHIPRIER